MKTRSISLILLFLSIAGILYAQDTIFVMKNGSVKYFRALSDIDSMSFVNTLDVRKSIVEKVAANPRFSLFYAALNATGLKDSLQMDKDRSYRADLYTYLIIYPKNRPSDYWYEDVPRNRYFRYTVLMESNETFSKNGIYNLENLKAFAKSIYDQLFPDDALITDVTDRRNSLNRFVAYHLISKKLTLDKLIDAYDTEHMLKTRDMFEYLETMCPNTLIEISKIRATNKTNQINRSLQYGNAIQIVSSSENDPKSNGVFHEIDGVLVYSKDFQSELSNKRLRFDFASFFDELTNNNLRGSGILPLEPRYILPNGYLKRMSCSASTSLVYLCPHGRFLNYQGDELSLLSSYNKAYEFSLETLPIPAGTYEVRFGYIANSNRGMAEIWFDGMPTGTPVNLNNLGSDPRIGNIKPFSTLDDPEGFENDKTLRNHGYMKGPACFKVPLGGFFPMTENARYEPVCLRQIIGTYSFQTAGRHVLQFKGLTGGNFQLDYMEFVPTSQLETEDIN